MKNGIRKVLPKSTGKLNSNICLYAYKWYGINNVFVQLPGSDCSWTLCCYIYPSLSLFYFSPLLDDNIGILELWWFSPVMTFVFHILLSENLTYFIYFSKTLSVLNLNLLAMFHSWNYCMVTHAWFNLLGCALICIYWTVLSNCF